MARMMAIRPMVPPMAIRAMVSSLIPESCEDESPPVLRLVPLLVEGGDVVGGPGGGIKEFRNVATS